MYALGDAWHILRLLPLTTILLCYKFPLPPHSKPLQVIQIYLDHRRNIYK